MYIKVIGHPPPPTSCEKTPSECEICLYMDGLYKLLLQPWWLRNFSVKPPLLFTFLWVAQHGHDMPLVAKVVSSRPLVMQNQHPIPAQTLRCVS